MSENTNSNNSGNENENSENLENKDQVPVAVLIKERKEKQELKKKLDAIEAAQKKADEDKLVEQGKLKEALDLKVKEFEDYKKSIEPQLKKASDFEEFQTKKREKIKTDLGDKWVESFNNIPLNDLEVVAEKLKAQPATQTNNGTGGTPPPATLSATEKEEAARMGLSDEGYTRYKETLNKLKENK